MIRFLTFPYRAYLRWIVLPWVTDLISDEIERHERHPRTMQSLRAERALILRKIAGEPRAPGSWRRHRGLASSRAIESNEAQLRG